MPPRTLSWVLTSVIMDCWLPPWPSGLIHCALHTVYILFKYAAYFINHDLYMSRSTISSKYVVLVCECVYYFYLTLSVLRLLLLLIIRILSKPCHVSFHFKPLAEFSQMSTHMPGFHSFSAFLNHFPL